MAERKAQHIHKGTAKLGPDIINKEDVRVHVDSVTAEALAILQ